MKCLRFLFLPIVPGDLTVEMNQGRLVGSMIIGSLGSWLLAAPGEESMTPAAGEGDLGSLACRMQSVGRSFCRVSPPGPLVSGFFGWAARVFLVFWPDRQCAVF